ncbi:hypothetical protein HXX76_004594 [Chlamydomonas incerta]|uniref:starch synthase n=1 Tax=Chlamydomonas incerta TaxID=51695 RepID=A0A835T8W9_CHLIN|nr:hypothetical protein HXX76_004594 [Chlamydomonas incerta]|eukprot:KAG2439232.1 hypothetical protein HXX76_004594 [Chlamydomonas incerta]
MRLTQKFPSAILPSAGSTPRRCGRRAAQRLEPCFSWQQRASPLPSEQAEPAPSGSGGSPRSASPSSGRTLNPEEDFMARARKMQQRIAKLKKLQERISQMKEERDFMAAYNEVEASASDNDDDDDDDSAGSKSSPEELRRWVASLMAASAERVAAAAAAKAAAAGDTGGTGGAAGAGGGVVNGAGAMASWRQGGGGGGYVPASPSFDVPPATLPTPPPPAQPIVANPAAAGAASASSPGGYVPGRIVPQHPAATAGPAAAAAAASTSTAPPAPGQPQQPVIRRYSVRYNSAAATKPTFVPVDGAPGASAGAGSSSSSSSSSTAAPQQQQQQQPDLSVSPWRMRTPALQPVSAAMAPPQAPPQAPPRAPPPAPPPPPPQQQQQPQQQEPTRFQSILAQAGTSAAAPASPSAAAAAPPGTRPATTATAAAVAAPGTPAAAAAAAKKGAAAAPAKPAAPVRDPDAELRATAFPESLTSTNPYTLYDMPLPSRPMPAAWQTAAERQAAAAAAAASGGGAAAAAPPAPLAVGRAERPRDLVFVTAEAAPWSKTGGLGDVMGALPRSLAARGHRVMVVSPRYLAPSAVKRYAGIADTGVRARLNLDPPGAAKGAGGGGVHEVGFHHLHQDGVDWVFVDHISYHREGTPYGNAAGTYGDNLFRFALLCMAACEAPLLLHVGGHRYGKPPGLPYGQNVTFIANDWHAGLVPVYVAAKYRRHGVYREARCVLALHNLAHQGAHPPRTFNSLGLPGEWYGALEWVDTGDNGPGGGGSATGSQDGGARHHLQRVSTINIMKAAMVTCDKLVTVSPAYAWEVCDEKGEQGMGLTSLLRQRMGDLLGIVNGIDVGEWDPRTDPYIPRNYHEGSLGGKGLCKAALQQELGLPVDPAAPLLGFIGRLDYQKGPDLVLGVLRPLVAAGCQVVLLGSGAADYEEAFTAAQKAFPANVRAHVGFSVPLSHKILAASDILLMPSRFEPCGLNQMYAMRYGTVPVAHGTGGLRDTIDDVNPFRGEGFTAAGGMMGDNDADKELDELFEKGLAWGRPTGGRSADDPSTNNADFYEPFQDYFGAGGRYGAVADGAEEDDEYGMYDTDSDSGSGSDSPADSDSPWRRGLQGLQTRRDLGTGWTFAPASEEALLDAVSAALAIYERHPDKWRRIQLAGMRRDFSWGRAARQWESVIEGVVAAPTYSK